MSEKPGRPTLEDRGKGVGMVLAGKTTRDVASLLQVSHSTVVRWMKKHKRGELLADKPRSGHPKVMSKVSKIVMAKSLTKKGNLLKNWHQGLLLLGTQCLEAQYNAT